uniref:conjugal transfer protein TraO n=1 Tax=Ornithobacterium rhinotracheale TaxID=28251 RepID=UPI0021AA3C18|nr:conjugal transfer protein TraO [Ornithobacterium rhinotracheale]
MNVQRLFHGQQGLEASINLLPTFLKLDTKAYDIRLGYIRYTREEDYWQFGVAYTRNFIPIENRIYP